MGEKKQLQKEKLEVIKGRIIIDRFNREKSRLTLGPNESLTIFLLPSLTNKNKTLDVYLQGDGSHVKILGATVGSGASRSNLNINIIHQGLSTSAYTHVRSVLFDDSFSYFSGLIKIEKGANKTSSLLENRVLILGEGARSESAPQLEIEADDVRASHAATTGQLDKTQLFYLQSRGIEEATATRMLIEGFFEPVLGRLPSEETAAEIRGELWTDILRR